MNYIFKARRMFVFRRLLAASTYKRQRLLQECKRDIAPFHRAFVWVSLLNISYDVNRQFEFVDTFTEHSADRQLMVDIPRCHQVYFY